jgi:hypothetical protein
MRDGEKSESRREERQLGVGKSRTRRWRQGKYRRGDARVPYEPGLMAARSSGRIAIGASKAMRDDVS